MDAKSIVQAFYTAYNHHDWTAVGQLLAPNVTWMHIGRDEQLASHKAVLSMIKSQAEATRQALVHVAAIHNAGNIVIVEGLYVSRTMASAPKNALPTFCDVLEVSEGKIIKAKTYTDAMKLLAVAVPSAA